MSKKLVVGNSKLVKPINMVVNNFVDFVKPFRENISGIRIELSIKDNHKQWHTMTQRIFKNGNIHISTR